MKPTDTTRATVWEDCGATNLARLVGVDGEYITQAVVSSIQREIFDIDGATPDVAVDSKTLVVADSVFDTLQTDARWPSTKDTIGYNFRDTVAASVLSTGEHNYQVEYMFTPSSGEVHMLMFVLSAKGIRSS